MCEGKKSRIIDSVVTSWNLLSTWIETDRWFACI